MYGVSVTCDTSAGPGHCNVVYCCVKIQLDTCQSLSSQTPAATLQARAGVVITTDIIP